MANMLQYVKELCDFEQTNGDCTHKNRALWSLDHWKLTINCSNQR